MALCVLGIAVALAPPASAGPCLRDPGGDPATAYCVITKDCTGIEVHHDMTSNCIGADSATVS